MASASTERASSADAKSVQRATLIGFIATIFWSCYGALVYATDATPHFLALAIFFTAGAATLLVRRLLLGYGVADLFRMPLSTLTLGFFGLWGNNALYVFAFTSGANPVSVNIVAFSWPVMMVGIVLLARLARATWWDGVAMVLGFVGVMAIAWDGRMLSLHPGLIMALAGALLWAIYSSFRRLVPVGVPDAMTAFLIAGAVASWGLHFALGEPFESSTDDIAALAIVGILPVGIANLMWDYGARVGDPVLLAGLSFVEPVLSSSIIALVHDTPFRAADIFGMTLVLVGIGCSLVSEKVRRRQEIAAAIGRA
jgi:drug/metabolite transporter (DMT)-like permease